MSFMKKTGLPSNFGKQIPSYYNRLTGVLNGGGSDPVFRSRWITSNTSTGSSTSTQVSLPLVSTGSYNFTVRWGDGSEDTITAWNQSEVTHTYSSADTYDIEIEGECQGWQFANTGDKWKIVSVSNWGELDISTDQAFYGCRNMTCSATDQLTISSALLGSMFRGCTVFNGAVNSWDVSAVTNMANLFNGCESFNQPIEGWDVTNNGTFASMFTNCVLFNQSLDNWSTKIGTASLAGIFVGCDVFNGDVTNWEVGLSTNLTNIFSGCNAFNQDISGWDLSNATSLTGFLNNATSFNQDLENMDVSSCLDFSSMFNGATSFNGRLTNWTFASSGNINAFNMIRNTAFNNDSINNWVTTRFTAMNFMLFNTPFDQDISGWDISNVTTINSMLRSTPFNRDISGWDIQSLTDAGGFLQANASFSQANYDALLIGWEANTRNNNVPLRVDQNFTAGGAAETAWNALDADGWTITDLGGV